MAVNFARACQLCAGFYLRQRPHAHRTGRVHNNARRKQPINNAGAQGFFHTRKFHRRIHTHERIIAPTLNAKHFILFSNGKANQICNIIFAALIAVVQMRQKCFYCCKAAIVHASINLIRGRAVERSIVILGFHNGFDLAQLAHHAAIRAGVVELNGGKGQVGPHGLGKERTNQRF